jgi:hypothetical protein
MAELDLERGSFNQVGEFRIFCPPIPEKVRFDKTNSNESRLEGERINSS